MKNNIRTALTVTFLLTLTGCVTAGVNPIISSAPTVTSKNPAIIEVERISTFNGALHDTAFKINDKELFFLGSGDSIGFLLDPGTYSIGHNLYYRGDKSGGCTFNLAFFKYAFEEGKSYKIEISPDCQDYKINGKKVNFLGNY